MVAVARGPTLTELSRELNGVITSRDGPRLFFLLCVSRPNRTLGRSDMRRKQVISVFMLVVGVTLLVVALAVGGASSATKKPGSAEALKGGTLRLVMNNTD